MLTGYDYFLLVQQAGHITDWNSRLNWNCPQIKFSIDKLIKSILQPLVPFHNCIYGKPSQINIFFLSFFIYLFIRIYKLVKSVVSICCNWFLFCLRLFLCLHPSPLDYFFFFFMYIATPFIQKQERYRGKFSNLKIYYFCADSIQIYFCRLWFNIAEKSTKLFWDLPKEILQKKFLLIKNFFLEEKYLCHKTDESRHCYYNPMPEEEILLI